MSVERTQVQRPTHAPSRGRLLCADALHGLAALL